MSLWYQNTLLWIACLSGTEVLAILYFLSALPLLISYIPKFPCILFFSRHWTKYHARYIRQGSFQRIPKDSRKTCLGWCLFQMDRFQLWGKSTLLGIPNGGNFYTSLRRCLWWTNFLIRTYFSRWPLQTQWFFVESLKMRNQALDC